MLTSLTATAMTFALSAVVGAAPASASVSVSVSVSVSAPAHDGGRIESAFTSLLGFAPGRGEVSGRIDHNEDAKLYADNTAMTGYEVHGRAGQNVVEASLLTDASGPGLWRFDFSGVPRFRAASLRVSWGDVVVLNARTLVVRTNGRRGPVVRFTYDLVP